MRSVFAHEAVLRMDAAADLRAPGAAITVGLCGHWEHEPPCPLAPHHTEARRSDEEVHLRTLFAVEPEREAEVRERIRAALAVGRLQDANGHDSNWVVRSSTPAAVRPEEADHGRRLASS